MIATQTSGWDWAMLMDGGILRWDRVASLRPPRRRAASARCEPGADSCDKQPAERILTVLWYQSSFAHQRLAEIHLSAFPWKLVEPLTNSHFLCIASNSPLVTGLRHRGVFG